MGMNQIDKFRKVKSFVVDLKGHDVSTREGGWKYVNWDGLSFELTQYPGGGDEQSRPKSLGRKVWGDLTLKGALTPKRKAMQDWLKAHHDGTDWRREITITTYDDANQPIEAINMENCFMLSYELTELDADGTQEFEETIVICVGRSPDYLNPST